MLHRTPPIKIIGLFMLILSLSGCASWFFGPDQDPDVQLIRVKVVKARLLQQDFTLRFRVDNPNDSGLLVRGLRYKVLLNDVELAQGESSEWFTVDANSHENFDVAVRTNLWQHLKYIAELMKHPDQPVYYRLEGKLKTGFLFGHSVRLARNGEIHMSK